MYPKYLRGKIYTAVNFQVAKRHLGQIMLNESPGTFSFYQINKPRLDYSGEAPKQVTYKKALARTGHEDLARLAMVEADEDFVGLMIATAQGPSAIRIKCSDLEKFHTLEELINDMVAEQLPIDPKKFIWPGMNYQPIYDDD